SHDRLTGLPNRSLIQVRIAEALKRAKVNHSLVGALFIDLDNFKTINDTLGHEMGDVLLVEVAKRIQRTIRPSDIAARLGGDEFVVILENTHDLDAGEAIARRLSEQFARPFQLGDDLRIVTASIGIALSDERDTEPSDILRKADVAMYQAKKEGKAGFSTFNSSMTMK
ncbi:MAG: GGDEF domain-containing protein, partial [Armatimonadota bacterium]